MQVVRKTWFNLDPRIMEQFCSEVWRGFFFQLVYMLYLSKALRGERGVGMRSAMLGIDTLHIV